MPPPLDKTAYIKLFAGINGNSVNAFMNIIDQKVTAGIEHLVILISSPGGSVFHGLSAYNYLRGLPVTVETHNFGSVDSIGVVLYLAGEKRYSVPDARFLLHPVSFGFSSNQRLEEKQLEEKLKSLQIDINNIAAVISKATGQKEKKIIKKMHERLTLTPEEAMKFGLVHQIKQELFPKGFQVTSINMS